MVEIAGDFGDVIIIDSTYGKNRFDMVIVNFVCIDAFGKSRIIGFGLLSCEEVESYIWIFEKFLNIQKLIPNVIYSDEDKSIISGLHFYFYILNNFISHQNYYA